MRANVIKGFNHQTPQFQVSSAYIKGEMAKKYKNGSIFPVLPSSSRAYE